MGCSGAVLGLYGNCAGTDKVTSRVPFALKVNAHLGFLRLFLFFRIAGQCSRSLDSARLYAMTARISSTLCLPRSVVPSKLNCAKGHFAICSSSLAKT